MDQFATPRLRAARLSADDLGDLVALHLDGEVSRFLGGLRTPQATAAYLDTNIRHWDEHGFGLWTLRTADGAFAGRAGLRYVDLEGRQELEIAYTLVRSAWGRGLGSEIAAALVAIWKAQGPGPSLVGLVEKGNSASEHVLQKTGFAYERDAVFHNLAVGVFRQDRAMPDPG
jgi:ribosomal-protein-alanine N-acetyltransferase